MNCDASRKTTLVNFNQLEIAIEDDFNQSAFAGDDDDQTGLQDITVTMDGDTDADDETIITWAQRVEERCPVSANMKNERTVQLSIDSR